MFQAKVAAGEGAFSECAVGRALCNARKLSGRCHAIKGTSPVPPPSKVNHGTSWAGATVCEWQLVQLDPLVAKNAMNSPVAGLGPPRQDWLIHLGAGAVGDPYWRSRSAWCSIGSAAALVAPAAGPFPSVCWGAAGGRAGGRARGWWRWRGFRTPKPLLAAFRKLAKHERRRHALLR